MEQKANPDKKLGSLDPTTLIYCYHVIETFLEFGTPLDKAQKFHPLLKRGGAQRLIVLVVLTEAKLGVGG